MLFPDISPSRNECFDSVVTALQEDSGRVYLDASVLIHCYEMNSLASEDLLSALERFGQRVGVPTWAAKETWDYSNKRITKRPLQSQASKLEEGLERFKSETTRYIDDDTLKDFSKEEFQQEIDEAAKKIIQLINQVAKIEPKTDKTTARLLPFIDEHRLNSDFEKILDDVSRTAQTRNSHQIPPGFADVKQPSDAEDDERGPIKGGRGKSTNPNGDLIIWFEILANCVSHEAEHLVFITRDIKKGDWVYTPNKIRDEDGRPLENNGLVTLPLPLLVHEAKLVCPSLKGVHVISVEMLTHVLRKMKVDVDNLTAALQADDHHREEAPLIAQTETFPSLDDNVPYKAEFTSSDMVFEPTDGNELDELIDDLRGEGWSVQNQAVRNLESLLSTATRRQRIQVGRGLVAAANNGAIEPTDFFGKLLENGTLDVATRSDILIGSLAEVYLEETGELKKPTAPKGIVGLLFGHRGDAQLAEAYSIVLDRLEPQKSKYLALPAKVDIEIPLEIVIVKGKLRGVFSNSVPLLEEDAPSSRLIQPSGGDTSMTLDELMDFLAEEFAVPPEKFKPDIPVNKPFVVPDLMGFVTWGPNSGTILQ